MTSSLSDGVLDLTIRVQNRAGHKLPTSFPSRRAILSLAVVDERGQSLFHSGMIREDGSVVGDDADVAGRHEPHHTLITSDAQVQIYESIMGNSDGTVTYTLLRGARYLKDNRILPTGARKDQLPSDIGVHGQAAADPDFVGGRDDVRYRIDGIASDRVHVRATLSYQTVSHAFAQDLARETHPPGERFARMFERSPDKTLTLTDVSVDVARAR